MAKSFLKWTGGKNWFIHRETNRLPLQYNRYIEPFLGGGSIFFFMNPEHAILSDINAELINTYVCMRDEFNSLYNNLKIHERNNSRDYYYKIRNRNTRTNATSAARTIYLNKACFIGIYRVNRNGKFNVPYGTAKNVYFNKSDLREASDLLRNAEIHCQDFELTIDMANDNDFIFCDPPYAVLDEGTRFVSYTADIFSWADQIRLSEALERARQRGVQILMTNVDHPEVRALYEENQGFELNAVERNCSISGLNEGRRIYSELIVTANI